jgi:hypothetical protein
MAASFSGQMPALGGDSAMADKPVSSREIKTDDDYVSRLLKLLPAEITGAYLAVRTICGPENNENDAYIGVFALVILIISPFFMKYVLKMRNNVQNAFMFFTYIVWVANIEIARIAVHEQQFHAFANGLAIWFGDFEHFILAPTFIKGMTVIWAILLSPFVFTGITKPKPPTSVVAPAPAPAQGGAVQ